MKRVTVYFVFCFFYSFCCLAQTMTINFKNGQNVKFNVESIDYIDFQKKSDDSINVSEGEAVDLGLSVKWASFNVGATSCEEHGDMLAWGETETKKNFSKTNYLYYDNYNECYINIGKDIGGTDFDAAHVKWGGNWRMPTSEELQELKDMCSWVWTKINGINGFKVTADNGNSIFFPSGSSTTRIWGSREYSTSFAYSISFGSGMQYANKCSDKWVNGYVRPVLSK